MAIGQPFIDAVSALELDAGTPESTRFAELTIAALRLINDQTSRFASPDFTQVGLADLAQDLRNSLWSESQFRDALATKAIAPVLFSGTGPLFGPGYESRGGASAFGIDIPDGASRWMVVVPETPPASSEIRFSQVESYRRDGTSRNASVRTFYIRLNTGVVEGFSYDLTTQMLSPVSSAGVQVMTFQGGGILAGTVPQGSTRVRIGTTRAETGPERMSAVGVVY